MEEKGKYSKHFGDWRRIYIWRKLGWTIYEGEGKHDTMNQNKDKSCP